MKGGDISTHRNGLLMEDSSAVLNASIRYAVIAEELLNHVTERAVTQKTSPSLIDQAGGLKFTYNHPLPSAQSCYSAVYSHSESFHYEIISQRKCSSSP